MDIPEFEDKSELIDFIVENKSFIMTEKKSAIKKADAISFTAKSDANKSASSIGADTTKIQVRSIINTTKLMDSHSDVHIDSLWNKSLRENKSPYLLQEHSMTFANIISDKVKASAIEMSWKELGFKFKGNTQALVFDSEISKDRNEFMFNQYAKGFVKNHSVGMQYVKLALAVNDEDYKEEFEVWQKHIDSVANKSQAEQQGYFWAVTQAKVIEGSAVPMGSNFATPTQSVEAKEGAVEGHSEDEPLEGTQKAMQRIILTQ